MHLTDLSKKIFTNIYVFVATFLIISTVANIVYLGRNTDKKAGLEGWTGQPDFKVFWIAARDLDSRILYLRKNRTGERKAVKPLYDKNEEFYHFRYSPTIALLFIPFGKIIYPRAALFLWSILLTFVFLAALLLLEKLFASAFALSKTQRYLILWGAFLATLRYYLMILGLGQTDVLIAFFLVLFGIAYLKDNEILCGIALALILHIKPFYLPFLAYFLLRRKITLVISAIVSFALFLLIPCVVIGWNQTMELIGGWREILSMSIPSQLFNFKNQSVSSMLGMFLLKNGAVAKFISPERLVYLISVIFIFSAYAAMVWADKSSQAPNKNKYKSLEISLLIIVSIIFSPISWQAYFVSLIIPFAFVMVLAGKVKKQIVLCAALGVYFLLACAVGTDITKFIPLVNSLRFINISLGTMFLAFAMIYAYNRSAG